MPQINPGKTSSELGKILITADLHGLHSFTAGIDATNLEQKLSNFEVTWAMAPADRQKPAAHNNVRNMVLAAASSPLLDHEVLQPMAVALLWCCLNQPAQGEQLRRAISDRLRKAGRAHVTAACDARRFWALAVWDRAVDLRRSLSLLPDQTVTDGFAIGGGAESSQRLS